MPKFDKKLKPFTRASGYHFDNEKWKTVVDKTKFEEKLDDIARRSNPTELREGDLFYEMNYDDDGWTDDDEEYFSQEWWEVLYIQKMNDDYEECGSGSATRIMAYVYPVDEFGNALTKVQIKKKFPSSADSWIYSIDKNVYACCREWSTRYEDEPLSAQPILLVRPSAIEDQNKDYKLLGRKIEYDPKPQEAKYGYGNAKRFYKKDANGDRIPKPEALKMWQDAHPGEKFDPEFDNFKKVKPAKNYNGEDYMQDLDDEEAFENDLVKFAGTREERRLFAKYLAQEDAEKEMRKNVGDDNFEMYSCFGGFTSKFKEANKDMATNHPKEYERACNSAHILGYGHDIEKSEFQDKKALKNFVLENDGDWEAFKIAMWNMSSQFAEARMNAYMANN